MRNQILEWEITAAPELDEGPWSSHMTLASNEQWALASRRSRPWLGRLAGGLILGVMLVTGMWGGWNAYRVRRAVEQVILDEDQAAPAPVQGLRPIARSGKIQSVTPFATDIVKATVVRNYSTPDGTMVTFTLPQFYRLTNAAWKRVPPPPSFWGDEQWRQGLYTTVAFDTVDESFIETDFGPYLDIVLAQICADWECPSDFNLQIDFTRFDASQAGADSFFTSIPGDPLVLALLATDPTPWAIASSPLYLPSPHATGIPVDGRSAALHRRLLALRVLLQAARLLVGSSDSRPRLAENAFFYALVARQAARLGLDPSVIVYQWTNPSFGPNDLWDMRWVTGAGADGRAVALDAVRTALAQLNRVLRDQPLGADRRLFTSFRSSNACALSVWLRHAVNLPVETIWLELMSTTPDATDAASVNSYEYFAKRLEHAMDSAPSHC